MFYLHDPCGASKVLPMNREHYHCAACGWFGDEPDERESFERYEFWGERGTQRFITVVCPTCRAEELDEAVPCDECGDAPATDDDWCAPCLAQLRAEGKVFDLEESSCE
jgi:hypothetical protein